MRAKRAALKWMESSCADNFGDMAVSIRCSSSSAMTLFMFSNTRSTRSRNCPDFSSATIVFSNVGLSGLAAMALTSCVSSASARSKAGS